MSEHPPTSIGIEYDRQDYDSRLSSRTESLKIIGVAQQKQKSILPSGDTTLL